MVRIGPDASGASGSASSTTNAVIVLATEAIGRGASDDAVARSPVALLATARLPAGGTVIAGGAPAVTTTDGGAWTATLAAGSGAVSRCAATTPPAPNPPATAMTSATAAARTMRR